jgi:hypothetical protein
MRWIAAKRPNGVYSALLESINPLAPTAVDAGA